MIGNTTTLVPHSLMTELIFSFNNTTCSHISTLSLHDALPIFNRSRWYWWRGRIEVIAGPVKFARSEEHTSELQSRLHLVCRLLLEKKNAWPSVLYDPHGQQESISADRMSTRLNSNHHLISYAP